MVAWVAYVEDKFGDYGLCGLLGLQTQDEIGEVSDFLLSCRVLGRGVEEAFLNFSKELAVKQQLKELCFPFKISEKNKVCQLFLDKSDLISGSDSDIYFYNIGSLS